MTNDHETRMPERLRGAGAGRDELKQDNARLKQHEFNRKKRGAGTARGRAAAQDRETGRGRSMCQALTCEVAALKGHLQKKQDDWAREAGVGRDENKELRVDKEIKTNVLRREAPCYGVECGGCCEDPDRQPLHWENGRVAVRRQVPHTTTLQHVKHVGYVCVLPADSPKLLALLKQIRTLVSCGHVGLRSLYTQDQFYEQRKAPGDNPYCRAQAVRSDRLQWGETALRVNVISNVYREYEQTDKSSAKWQWKAAAEEAGFSRVVVGRRQAAKPRKRKKVVKVTRLSTFQKRRSSMSAKAKPKAKKSGEDEEMGTWWKDLQYRGTDYMDILAGDKVTAVDGVSKTPRSPL
ncbi:uncharacterized protein KRP23_10957 [Phytophthora ramorum]|uniref:uncharacterized protein n=1 Tax=Phytophthora ramorum TaxID=164328 RepID=UPI0030970FB0|nr:hypothetical protein KRP23_10957 [Phytophthora ramorum]